MLTRPETGPGQTGATQTSGQIPLRTEDKTGTSEHLTNVNKLKGMQAGDENFGMNEVTIWKMKQKRSQIIIKSRERKIGQKWKLATF